MSDRLDDLLRLLHAPLDDAGPARRLPDWRTAELARAVCERADEAPPHVLRPRRTGWMKRAAAAIALGMALSALATAGWMHLHTPRTRSVPPLPVGSPPVPTAAAPRQAISAPPRPPRPVPRERRASVASTERPTRPNSSPAGAAVARADVLERANQLRAQRRWREAADAYAAAVVDGEPREAYVATLARATLLLERLGRPAEALALFRRALADAPDGALADEASYGLAASFRALGESAEERATLERLLAERPSTLLRPRVEARLAELR
jgi:tetratricopeptide (TPR) repeat protein